MHSGGKCRTPGYAACATSDPHNEASAVKIKNVCVYCRAHSISVCVHLYIVMARSVFSAFIYLKVLQNLQDSLSALVELRMLES